MSIRGLVRRVAPQIAADRARRHERHYREGLGLPELARRLPPVVQSGPFAGLRYPDRFEEIDAPVAKLLGLYESEMAAIFEAATGPFYDIGSADGYYAVGMALRGHRVVAWDTSRNARELCAVVAKLNGVSIDQRVTYNGEPIGADGLVLCDIEGAENEMLTPAVAAGLPTVVVEVHEDERPGTSDRLRAAFALTHTADRIDQAPRQPPPAITDWAEEERNRAITEFRPPLMHWLLFTRH